MKPHFVLFLVFILSTSVRAQNDLKVFKSYDDYVAGNGEEMMYKNLYWPSAKSIGIKALKGSENVKIDPREHWGFTYKDVLFRFDHTYNQPVRVVHVGPLVF